MNDDLMKENAELRRQLDLVTSALEGLHTVCELALSGEDGLQHANFETRAGNFVCAVESMQAAEDALAAVRKPAGSPAGEGGV